MPRCQHCGSLDLTGGFDYYHCNDCGHRTNMATGKAPPEGLFSNSDLLASACVEFMIANHPNEYRVLADTVAGQPDPGTAPGGAPLTDTTPEAPVVEPEPMPAEVSDTPEQAPSVEPEGSPSPEPTTEAPVEPAPETAPAPAPEAPPADEPAAEVPA